MIFKGWKEILKRGCKGDISEGVGDIQEGVRKGDI